MFNEKIISTSPRDTLQKAYQFNWIDNETVWLDMMDNRNLTFHTYREEYAKKIYSHIKCYYLLFFAKLLKFCEQHVGNAEAELQRLTEKLQRL